MRLTGNPSFWMILAYLRAASRESISLLAPVHTILPLLKMSAVVRGSRILMITAAKRFGLYSALRACSAIFFRSNLQPKFTVETIFLQACRTQILVYTRPYHCLEYNKWVDICKVGRGGGRNTEKSNYKNSSSHSGHSSNFIIKYVC